MTAAIMTWEMTTTTAFSARWSGFLLLCQNRE